MTHDVADDGSRAISGFTWKGKRNFDLRIVGIEASQLVIWEEYVVWMH